MWQLVSGIHHETPEATVKEELFNVSKELQDGILQFKTANSTKNNLEKLLSEKKQEKLLPFTLRLQELLVIYKYIMYYVKIIVNLNIFIVFRILSPYNVGKYYAII